MRSFLLGSALLIGLEAAAIACSCARPGSPEDARGAAREALDGAVAIVEADILSGYDRSRRRAEQVRVVKTLYGKAPRAFRLDRARMPNSAMCDLELAPGKRRMLILYPGAKAGGATGYRIQNLCSDYLVSDPRYLAVTLQEARRR